jgi:hypothetical protein
MEGSLRTGWMVEYITEEESAEVDELLSLTKYEYTVSQDNSLVRNEIMLVALHHDFDLRSELTGEVRLFHVYY